MVESKMQDAGKQQLEQATSPLSNVSVNRRSHLS